jgi:hypothetical protein
MSRPYAGPGGLNPFSHLRHGTCLGIQLLASIVRNFSQRIDTGMTADLSNALSLS